MESTVPAVKSFILEKFLPGEPADALTPSTELIHSGILDSLARLELVAFLEQRFGIELEAHDTDGANFGTLEAIDRLVQGKQAGR